MNLVLALLVLVPFLGPGSIQDGDDAAVFARFESGDPATFGADLARLAARGEAAATLALDGFEGADDVARRARARLLVETVGGAQVERTAELATDPDPEVRRRIMEALGARRLVDASASLRLQVLLRAAAQDAEAPVRGAALEALAHSSLSGTARALDALLVAVPAAEAETVARELAGLAAGRVRLVGRVRSAFRGEHGAGRPLPASVLAILLGAYGGALAELPRGGDDAGERLPLVAGRRHPSAEVRAASEEALTGFLRRLAEFSEFERADRVLTALETDGWPRTDLLVRRLGFALARRGDIETTQRLASDLEDAALGAPGVSEADAATFRFYALHYRAAARFAAGDFDAARAGFVAASELVEALVGERLDRSRREVQSLGGRITADRMELAALESLWIAATRLAQGEAIASPRVLAACRHAHVLLLGARVVDLATDAQAGAASFESVLLRDLAPGPLLFAENRIADWSDGRGTQLLMRLGSALATAARFEVPGFTPAAKPPPGPWDLFSDPERLDRLFAYREAWRSSIGRRLARLEQGRSEAPDAERQALLNQLAAAQGMERRESERLANWTRAHGTEAMPPEETAKVFRDLANLVTRPSLFSLDLAQSFRDEGRTAEARATGEVILSDLRARRPGSSDVWVEWASARVELLVGSTYMDDGDASEAERLSQNAVRRLEELETTLITNGADPETDDTVRELRTLRGSALLSLAVNANVGMHDTVRALKYFERAFELDQRDFMQVLLACYRARSGHADEARAVLKTIEPSPPLYYNIACTYALLGDSRDAVDFLQREFLENHPTKGSLERQKEWAKKDPDFASLHDDPAFRRLVGMD